MVKMNNTFSNLRKVCYRCALTIAHNLLYSVGASSLARTIEGVSSTTRKVSQTGPYRLPPPTAAIS